jgi:hypothetical protein
MKNEAVRVFFAMIALMLVAMLTNPILSETPNLTPLQRNIATLGTLTSPVATAAKSLAEKNPPKKKIIKKKKIASRSEKKRKLRS